ncbi:MAG: MurR/RpiR family transcriptional regulator [Oscillospiraceae bacterium]|nr:MurR/RpiR family transcriptional regulator [Oscillospiraceae bacterium]
MAYYGKLPIVLLSELAAGRADSYNCRIASYLLGRMGQSVNVEEIARECYVSKSAVSRFCRDVGLEDFSELRDLLLASEGYFGSVAPGLPAREQAERFCALASDSMRLVAESLDPAALDRLAAEIAGAERVACFGMLKAETAALALQSDLVMLGKRAVTKVAFQEQMELLASAGPETLVLVFSYRGVYFDYGLPRDILKGRPRLWVVTGSRDAKARLRRAGVPVNGVLSFASRQDFASHPYQLLLAAGLIAQRTAEHLRQPPEGSTEKCMKSKLLPPQP